MDKHIGQVFGYYEILEYAGYRNKNGNKVYKAKCIHCGIIVYGKPSDLMRSTEKKCEHKIRYAQIPDPTGGLCEGWANPKIGARLCSMVSRCYNPDDKDYKFYGGKGIRVCDEWLNEPKLFEVWAENNGYKQGMTIDRVNPDKDYCPENCRWITRSENSKWKSTTNRIEVCGIVDSGKGWANRLGLGVNFINRHIRNHGLEATIEFIEGRL